MFEGSVGPLAKSSNGIPYQAISAHQIRWRLTAGTLFFQPMRLTPQQQRYLCFVQHLVGGQRIECDQLWIVEKRMAGGERACAHT